MLTLSSLQAGSEYMESARLELRDILHDVASGYAGVAAQNGIELIVEAPDRLPDALGDADRIEQVIVILLDNALRYTPEGETVTIGVSDGESLTVSVTDTGCGIPQEDLEHIFERFYKVDKSRGEGGTGLGLYIAKTILNKLGEEITAESELDKGTRFSFTVKKYARNAIALGPATMDDFGGSTAQKAYPIEAGKANVIDAPYEVINSVEAPKKWVRNG